MSLKLRSCTLGVVAALCAVAPMWAQNSFAIVCPATTASGTAVTGGTQIACMINLTLASGVQVDALSYNVNVTPSTGAPVVTGIAFTDGLTNIDGGSPSSHTAGANFYSVVWIGLSPVLTGP